MRELIYISLLAGFVSAYWALDRGLCSSLCRRCHSHGLCCLPAGELIAPTLFNNPPLLARPSGGGWRPRHPAPSDWATTFQTNTEPTFSSRSGNPPRCATLSAISAHWTERAD